MRSSVRDNHGLRQPYVPSRDRCHTERLNERVACWLTSVEYWHCVQGLRMLGRIKALRGSANRWQVGDDLRVGAWDRGETVRIDISIDEWRSLCDRFGGNEEAAVAAMANLASRSPKEKTTGVRGYTVRATLS